MVERAANAFIGGVDERLAKFMGCMKFVICLFLCAAVTCEAQTAPLPQIRPNGEVKQFFVDDKPFIMLAGELHNSSPSSIDYMRPIWDKLAALHLNTVARMRFETLPVHKIHQLGFDPHGLL